MSETIEIGKAFWVETCADIKRLTAERDALKAENKKMREALEKITAFEDDYVLFGHDYSMLEIARAALKK